MKNAKFDINPHGRDFFVGDVHGMFDAFMHELRVVDFDFDKDRVFSVGDLIDRGPDSMKCLDLLNRPWFHAVRGNHEDMLLGNMGWMVWMMNGGDWINDESGATYDELKVLVRKKMHHKMEVDTVHGRIGVLHADAIGHWPDITIDQHDGNETVIFWGRDRYYAQNTDSVTGIEAVVVGHTPLKKVVNLGNVLYIDTGACFKNDRGFLTLMEAKDVFQTLE